MKTTPIYGLPYIEAGDLVSSAPAQFKTMAEGFENALNEVDSRNTPAGVKPAIATTLETLAGITGVTGQAGYVTADPAEGNNGPYCWTGSAWARIATISDVSDILAEDSSTVMLINSTYGTIKGYRRGKLATLRIDWKKFGQRLVDQRRLRKAPRRMVAVVRPQFQLRRPRRSQPENHQRPCRRHHGLHQQWWHPRYCLFRLLAELRDRMTESIISALIGTGGVAVGACVQFVATWAKTRSDKDTDASRLLIEAQRQLDQSARDRQLLWLWNRELVDAIWRRAPPPPPSAPDGLFQDNDDGKE